MSDAKVFTSIIVGAMALVAAVVVITIHFVYINDRVACASFGQQSGREVKFVDYTYWSWGCLTPQADGKWVDVHNLRGVGSQ